jgi:nicotinate-nucleotide--dimethylbenzimidazole phosphoribosyltransferase
MGIGNTTTAAALLVASGMDIDEVVDRGTGIDDAALARKRSVVESAAAKHAPYSGPEAVLKAVGGYDLAMMAGFILGLRGLGIACVLDGFPVTSAAYMAWRMDRSVADFLFSGHRSKVRGHLPVLQAMGLEPILDLGMRLGEGTGAVLGAHLIDMAVKTSREMASFESAEVTRSTDDEKSY